MQEILAPSVKHSQEANLGTQMLGVRRDCQQVSEAARKRMR